jgi:hypothetical protein
MGESERVTDCGGPEKHEPSGQRSLGNLLSLTVLSGGTFPQRCGVSGVQNRASHTFHPASNVRFWKPAEGPDNTLTAQSLLGDGQLV